MLDPKPLIIDSTNLDYFDKIMTRMLADIKRYATENKDVMPISLIWKLNSSRMFKLGIDLLDLQRWLEENNHVEYMQNIKLKGFIMDKEYWNSIDESARAKQKMIINTTKFMRNT